MALNVVDNSAREYIYEFFSNLQTFQTTSSSGWGDFETAISDYETAQATLQQWYIDNNLPDYADPADYPLFGTSRPEIPVVEKPDSTMIQLTSDDIPEYDMRLSWINIDEETGSGLGKVDAEVGELWFEIGTSATWSENHPYYDGGSEGEGWKDNYVEQSIPVVELYWQVSESSYKKLIIRGMVHENYVYSSHSVSITAKEALEDTEESGFIVPMHYPTMREMSLVDSTQMVTANTWIVFNCYTITKQKWWQTGFFKLLLIVAIIAISVIFAPAGAAAAGGLLGTNVAVGTALGLTGTSAIIAGAVANALAGMVVSLIVQEVATKLFGAKIGAIVAAVVGFALSAGMVGPSAGSMNFNFANMLKVDNILKLTQAIGKAYQGWVEGDIAEMQSDLEGLEDEYESQLEEIQALASEFNTGVYLDPMRLTNVLDTSISESPSQFLSRTTMTGTDIIDFSFDLIYNFTDITLKLPEIGDS